MSTDQKTKPGWLQRLVRPLAEQARIAQLHAQIVWLKALLALSQFRRQIVLGFRECGLESDYLGFQVQNPLRWLSRFSSQFQKFFSACFRFFHRWSFRAERQAEPP